MRRTEVWISRDESVFFLEQRQSLDASRAMRSKMSLMKEFMKLNSYLVSLVKWMKIKPGPRDRGPLTLLGYLRHAILEMGGFPGFYGNAAYEPLRRELVEGLEPF